VISDRKKEADVVVITSKILSAIDRIVTSQNINWISSSWLLSVKWKNTSKVAFKLIFWKNYIK